MDPTGQTSFESWVSAIIRADVENLRAMIYAGSNLRITDCNGTTLLMVAASNARNSTDALQLLINARVPLNTRDNEGHTAVSWAAVMGCERAMLLLLDAGADFNIRSQLGPLPLHFAASQGSALIVEELLSRKGTAVDAMADASGHTPLILASKHGHTAVLKVLIKRKADIDRTDGAGHTALMWAAREGFEKAIEVLASAGADVNFRSSSGFSPIHLAAQGGCIQAMVSLLNLGAAIDQKSEGQGRTPLMLAILAGHIGMATELIARGANLEIQDYQGMTALRFAEGNRQALDQHGMAARDLAEKSNYEALADMLASHAELKQKRAVAAFRVS